MGFHCSITFISNNIIIQLLILGEWTKLRPQELTLSSKGQSLLLADRDPSDGDAYLKSVLVMLETVGSDKTYIKN